MAKKIKDAYDRNPHCRHRKYKIMTNINSNTKNVAEVELNCKIDDTPEGLGRISESLEKVI